MTKSKKVVPRYNGRPEFWFNDKTNMVVIRKEKHHCEVLRMSEFPGRSWEFCFFKKQFTFDFYDGSKYLIEKGFKLIFRFE